MKRTLILSVALLSCCIEDPAQPINDAPEAPCEYGTFQVEWFCVEHCTTEPGFISRYNLLVVEKASFALYTNDTDVIHGPTTCRHGIWTAQVSEPVEMYLKWSNSPLVGCAQWMENTALNEWCFVDRG